MKSCLRVQERPDVMLSFSAIPNAHLKTQPVAADYFPITTNTDALCKQERYETTFHWDA